VCAPPITVTPSERLCGPSVTRTVGRRRRHVQCGCPRAKAGSWRRPLARATLSSGVCIDDRRGGRRASPHQSIRHSRIFQGVLRGVSTVPWHLMFLRHMRRSFEAASTTAQLRVRWKKGCHGSTRRGRIGMLAIQRRVLAKISGGDQAASG
jgi:hypothetical protein